MGTVNSENIELSIQCGNDMHMVMVSDGNMTAFSGVARNDFLTVPVSLINDRVKNLLIRAVNNRTRERNYFKLYSQLLDNSISDEEFEKAIEKNEDDFVVSQDCEADLNDMKLALSLASEIKDVTDVDDIAALFSFSYSSITKKLNC